MSSINGDDVVEDILNGNLHELPSDDENEGNGREDLFGDEAEGGKNEDGEQQGVKVEPKKRSVRNPRPKLSLDTLTGLRGIHTIEDYFKDISYKGKGYEKRDLDEVMRRMAHWAHRMYPNYTFDDVLTNIERIGKKKSLQVHMSRYRLGMLDNLKTIDGDVQEEEDDGAPGEAADEPFDEFDALLGEQIAISKIAPRTPGHYSNSGGDIVDATFTGASTSTLATPSFHRGNAAMSTPYTSNTRTGYKINDSDLARPLPPSQPASPAPAPKLTSEQMSRIAENRRIALERLKAKKERLMQQQEQNTIGKSIIESQEM